MSPLLAVGEGTEVVFIPGQASQPKRGTGNRWEQWFGTESAQASQGQYSKQSSDAGGALPHSGFHKTDDIGDNLKLLLATMLNSLD